MGEIFGCRKDKDSDRNPRFRLDLARCQENLYFFKNKKQDKGSGKISRIRLDLARCQKINANSCSASSYFGKINKNQLFEKDLRD